MDIPDIFVTLSMELINHLYAIDFMNLFYSINRFDENIQRLLLRKKIKIKSKFDWYIFQRELFLRHIFNIKGLTNLSIYKKNIIFKYCDKLFDEEFNSLTQNVDFFYFCETKQLVYNRRDTPIFIIKNILQGFEKDLQYIKINCNNINLTDTNGFLIPEIFQFLCEKQFISFPFSLIKIITFEQFLKLKNMGRINKSIEKNYINYYCNNHDNLLTYFKNTIIKPDDFIFCNTNITADIVKKSYEKVYELYKQKNIICNVECNFLYKYCRYLESIKDFNDIYVKEYILNGNFFHFSYTDICKCDDSQIYCLFRLGIHLGYELKCLIHNRNFIKLVSNNAIQSFKITEQFTYKFLSNMEIYGKISNNFYFNFLSIVLSNDTQLDKNDKEMLEFLKGALKDRKILSREKSEEFILKYGKIKLPFLIDISVFPLYHINNFPLLHYIEYKSFQYEQYCNIDIEYLVGYHPEIAITDFKSKTLIYIVNKITDENERYNSFEAKILLQYFPNIFISMIDIIKNKNFFLCCSKIENYKHISTENMYKILNYNILISNIKTIEFLLEREILLVKDKNTGLVSVKKDDWPLFLSRTGISFWCGDVVKLFKWSWSTLYRIIKSLIPMIWITISKENNLIYYWDKNYTTLSTMWENGYYTFAEVLTIMDVVQYEKYLYYNKSVDKAKLCSLLKNKKLLEFIFNQPDLSTFDLYNIDDKDFPFDINTDIKIHYTHVFPTNFPR